MGLSTHVLDLALGVPAAGVPVRLERRTDDGLWMPVTDARTDDDGRVRSLVPKDAALTPGVHRLTFDVAAYLGEAAFFPEAALVFRVSDASAHLHVPLLLSPYGYSTYRGS